jgi:two-component system nitrogen regulation sensor histidine kinase GlnL
MPCIISINTNSRNSIKQTLLAWNLLKTLASSKFLLDNFMYMRILDHLNSAILLFNKELTLTYINTAGEILFAGSSRHLIGQSAYDLFKLSDPAVLANLQQCLSMEEPLIDRALTLHVLGQTMTINFSATPLINDTQVDEVLVEVQQVDNHLRISKEEQLNIQQNTARLLVRGLAHEIKNPLGGLRGAAQLLDLELTDPELKEYTKIIIAESDRLHGLMDKMLGPNKLPNKQLLNIHEVVERVRQLVQAEASGNLNIVCDYDPSIPDLHGDKDQLIQAILNIVKNAVQACDGNGLITLKTRIDRHINIGRKHYKLAVKCDIIDNGTGIDSDMMNQIFYPMITGRANGTGLGLSIAQALINQHNGLIECSSEPGNTMFSIFLPLGVEYE